MTASFELVPPGGTPSDAGAEPLEWQTGTSRTGFSTSLTWDLESLGTQQQEAADFLRIAITAFLADRSVPRGTVKWSRDIRLLVPVADVALWSGPAGEQLVDLLWWITGDRWELQPLPGGDLAPSTLALAQADRVMLLSGGLDSLCGTVLTPTTSLRHVGHRGAETAAVAAQNKVYDWVADQYPMKSEVRSRLIMRKSAEKTSRSRSLLFMAMGVAAAAPHGVVSVPENGFTSVNLALRAGRGGTCSTRSTHPYTFRQVNSVLTAAGIPATVDNPHAQQTKGEMVRAANNAHTGFADIAAVSLSCSKLNGARYGGGNPNSHCGLCVACLVRRAAFLSAGVPDSTDYLAYSLPGPSRTELMAHRQLDIDAVKNATGIIPTLDEVDQALMASASWRDDGERHAAAVVYRRGLEELSRVTLP